MERYIEDRKRIMNRLRECIEISSLNGTPLMSVAVSTELDVTMHSLLCVSMHGLGKTLWLNAHFVQLQFYIMELFQSGDNGIKGLGFRMLSESRSVAQAD